MIETRRRSHPAPHARALLAVALACQDGFDSLLLTWFQIESVPLNFLNDFLLQNLALEAP